MALDSTNVRVAVSGAVYVGATTETAPTSTSTALGTGWTDLGYVSADGIAEATSRSTNQIRAWQDASLVREVVTEATYKLTFTLLETKAEVLELYYGSALSTGVLSGDPAATGGRKSFVLDVVDGADIERIYIPSGEITEVGERTLASGDAIGYQVTVTAYAKNGVTFKKFFSALGA